MTLPFQAAPAADDDGLVGAAGHGEQRAFEELYRRHCRMATRVAERVVGNEEDACDVVAEAFLRVFAAVASGRLRQRRRSGRTC